MKEKYVFIDRDGVINRDGSEKTEHGYIIKWEDFEFLPGVLEGFKKFKDNGFKCVIVTNQQCVGKELITEEGLEEFMNKIALEVKKSGGEIAGIFYCPHLEEELCDCRKPQSGLFHKARKELNIESFEGRYYIGDSERDVLAGKGAGLKTILVLTGHSKREDVDSWEFKPDHICENLLEAADLIIK